MIDQRSQVACEIESVEGTAETLVAADVLVAFEPEFEPIIEMAERNPARSSLSSHPSVPGARSARMRFKAELVGGGAGYGIGSAAAGVNNGLSDALRACGVAEVLVASTSATYTPASASVPSVTLGLHKDGKLYKLWGARGNCSLVAEKGKPVRLEFDFLGADFSITDASLLGSVTYNTTLPPAFLSASLTVDSYAATLSRLSIDFGNTLHLRPDVNTASGHKSCVITDRRPMMSFDPEEVLVATEDYFGNWRGGGTMAFTTTIGSAAGNTHALTAPALQYHDVKKSSREGQTALEIQALMALSSGDDEWQLQIT